MSSAALAPRALHVLAIAAALALVLAGLLTAPVRAAGITVNTTTDEYDTGAACSLREAVVAANTDAAFGGCTAGSGPDVITIPAGTHRLTNNGIDEEAAAEGDLDLIGSVSVIGAGAGATIIDWDPFTKGQDRIFHVISGSAAISNVTLRNGGFGGVNGGGAFVNPAALLTLTNAVVDSNFGDTGGGIFVDIGGSLSLSGTTVSDNGTNNGGGGIYLGIGALATVSGSTISGNDAFIGGGIDNEGGSLDVIGSVISGNEADDGKGGFGAGIFNAGALELVNSTVSGNTAASDGGGIYSEGTLIQGEVAFPTSLVIDSSTISGNTAVNDDGGGVLSNGPATIINSTISGNTAGDEAGGFMLFGEGTIDFSTIASNTALDGGGIWVVGSLELWATIVANNSDVDCLNADAELASLGSNLDSDNTCELDPLLNDHPDVDPVLGALAANGGPTQTRALLAGSPAIDAVVPAGGEVCIGDDQRGVARPQNGDNTGPTACDIGAFEVAGAVPPTSTPVASQLPNTSATGGGVTDPLLLIGSVVLLLLALPGLLRRYVGVR
jgi:CSLREA domain-containing protein